MQLIICSLKNEIPGKHPNRVAGGTVIVNLVWEFCIALLTINNVVWADCVVCMTYVLIISVVSDGFEVGTGAAPNEASSVQLWINAKKCAISLQHVLHSLQLP